MMGTISLILIVSLFVITSGLISPAFADHATASVSTPQGTSVPGCEATNECYIPYEVTIDVGGEVTWSNDDTAAHTVTGGSATGGPSGVFDSSLFMAGTTFSHKFDEVGNYPYFCMVHPWMEGLVIVQPAAEEVEEVNKEEVMVEETKLETTIGTSNQNGPITEINVGKTALWVEIFGDKVYVTNPEDGTIIIIDSATNQIIDTINSVKGVAVVEVVEEKNKIYASALQQPQVYVYDLTTGESLGEIDIGEPDITMYSKADQPYGQREYTTFDTNAIGLEYDSSTELLYAVHSTVNHVNYIDTKTDKNLGDIPVGRTPLLIEIDEERNIGYVTNRESNNVSVIDLESKSQIKTLNTGFVPDQMEIVSKNNRMYVTHHASSHVSVIDLRTQEIETKVEVGAPNHAIAFDEKNGLIHVTYLPESGFTGMGEEDRAQFIDTNTNKIAGSFAINTNPFTIDIDSKHQKLFATRINDGVVVAVDLESHEDYQKVLSEMKEISSQPSSTEGGGCLIATAAFGTELAPQIQLLREIRDNTVMSTTSGSAFMTGFNNLYYSFSPTIADMERENPLFQETVRILITPMISTLSIMTLAEQGSEADVLGLGISVIALNIGLYIAAPAVVVYQIKKKL